MKHFFSVVSKIRYMNMFSTPANTIYIYIYIYTHHTNTHTYIPSPDNSKSLGELGLGEEEGGGTCFCDRGDIADCKGTELALVSVARGEDETLEALEPVSPEGSASSGSCKALFSSCSMISERCRSTRFCRPCSRSRRMRAPSFSVDVRAEGRVGSGQAGQGKEK